MLGRLFGRSQTFAPESSLVLNQVQFRTELIKEIYRSDRRKLNREFGLIRMLFPTQGDMVPPKLEPSLIGLFRERLRITDCIGWYDSSLAFLLPETDKPGTLAVANGLAEICRRVEIDVDTEVSIYPWDDEMIALSDELTMELNSEVTHDDPPDFPTSSQHSGPTIDQGDPDLQGHSSAERESAGEPLAVTNDDARWVVESRHSFVRSCPTPWWKRSIDILGAGIGVIMLAPVFLTAAIAIKLTSKGPVLFVQLREGKDGRQFGILKFRTMIVGAEEKQQELRERNEQDGPAFKLMDDPRITFIGRYLRKSCIDELPQLINVLLGDMSLVGPRPLPIHESYACRAWQRARLTVLPGLTCTWQVRSRRDVKFVEWMRMDLNYIENRSFLLDMRLICMTAVIAMKHKGSV